MRKRSHKAPRTRRRPTSHRPHKTQCKKYQINPSIKVDSNTPPTFLLQAGNDPVDSIQNSLVYYIALRKAGVHAEYHIFAEGGHAFGLNKTSQPIPNWTKLPIAGWPTLVTTWLQTIKAIP